MMKKYKSQINRKNFEIVSLHKDDDSEFWRNKTYLERIEVMEKLRRIIFGYDPSTERLQRIFTITQLKKH